MDQVLRRLHNLASSGAGSGRVSTFRAAEIEYGKEYQRLVRAGLKPQIRKKYRP